MTDITISREIKSIIEELDVSYSKYEIATNRYNSIANYIKNSELSKTAQIYTCKDRLNWEQPSSH